uniref:Uncharacterized protein n=1 Tax=Kalanchoe fedtschenkoi TaxID=63787 RepID=A0A7N1A225_KALFE
MGSGYYGEMNMGMGSSNNGSSSSSMSSRRGKKSSNSPNKPKQPQRGLGVAQLEKIRLHGQLGSTSYTHPAAPYMPHHLTYPINPLTHQEAYGSVPPSASSYASFHQPNMMMGFGSMEAPSNMGWNGSTTGDVYESQQVHYSQAEYMTRPFLSAGEARRNNNEWGRSRSHDSESSDTQQEVDLELRL